MTIIVVVGSYDVDVVRIDLVVVDVVVDDDVFIIMVFITLGWFCIVVEVAVDFPHIVYNFIVKYRLYIFKVIIL